MKKTSIAAIAASVMTLSLAAACTRTEAVENIPAGTEVTVVTQDGTLVRGKIAKVDADVVTLTGERPNTTTEITRSSIAEVKRVEAESEPRATREAAPIVRTITIPDNTVLDVTLDTALASDTSRVEAARQRHAGVASGDRRDDSHSGRRRADRVTSRMLTTPTRSRAARSWRSASRRLTTGSVTLRHRHQAALICCREHQER